MLAIFLKTLPFFALIGLGWIAGRRGWFPEIATAWLTRFVFYFALSAMLFRFAAELPLRRIFDPAFVGAYLVGTSVLWLLAIAVARLRRQPPVEAAMEAHCAITGNTGFLGLPMLGVILGPASAGPILMTLTTDLIVYSTLVTLIVAGARAGRISGALFLALGRGLVRNPMIMSMLAGIAWAQLRLPLPAPAEEFLASLASAATPCALFAIGASLASRGSVERPGPAAWLSLAKLLLHPAACAAAALWLFPVEPFAVQVMIATCALPVAGNVYMLAHHFGAAQNRVSAAILVSTAASIVTVPLLIALAERIQ
ncbi:AEC family transporter [Frigidibacter sp. MR17.24]|uniref:AEC family transporter n=1 Tax=Frigidibacter sp. MR17.24 TaxID=3127345 RepID=UPI003012F4D8